MDQPLFDLARHAGETLERTGLRLVTAESCTGGWIAKAITDVPGSSAWFERGFVAYSNEAKQDLLGVDAQTLETFGAVSEEVARAMAEGALGRSRADLAVAVTGIAGPSGGTADKPVGLVCLAWARGGSSESRSVQLTGDREVVRHASVVEALNGVVRAAEGG